MALTAYASAVDRMRALAAVQTHVAKPIEAAELASAIAGLAGRGTGGAATAEGAGGRRQ